MKRQLACCCVIFSETIIFFYSLWFGARAYLNEMNDIKKGMASTVCRHCIYWKINNDHCCLGHGAITCLLVSTGMPRIKFLSLLLNIKVHRNFVLPWGVTNETNAIQTHDKASMQCFYNDHMSHDFIRLASLRKKLLPTIRDHCKKTNPGIP